MFRHDKQIHEETSPLALVSSCHDAHTVRSMPTNFITWLNELSVGQPQLLTFADHDGNKTGDMLKDTPLATPHEIPGVIRDVATIPGVDMEIKDTEVEHANKEMDPTKMPITSDAPIVKTADDNLPMFNLKGDDNPTEPVTTKYAPIKVKKTTTIEPASPEGIGRSSQVQQASTRKETRYSSLNASTRCTAQWCLHYSTTKNSPTC